MSAQNEQSFQAPPPPSIESKPRGPRPTKLLAIGIGIAVLGALVTVGGGIAKLIPGGVSTGAAVGFFGILMVVFSFIRLPYIPETERALSLLEKATGVFYEPSRVFRNLRDHPHWVGAFVIIAVLTAIYSFAFIQRITPERIVDHTTAKLAEMGPPFAPPPEQIERIKTDQLQSLKSPVERVGSVLKSLLVYR